MSYVFSPPSSISFAGQGGSWSSGPGWIQLTSHAAHNGTTVFAYGESGTTDADAIFRFNATTGAVTFEVNSAQTSGPPQAWSQSTTLYPGFPGTQPTSLSSDGDVLTPTNHVHMWDAHSGAVFLRGYFTFQGLGSPTPWVTSATGTEGTSSGSNTPSGTIVDNSTHYTFTVDSTSPSTSGVVAYNVLRDDVLYGVITHTNGQTTPMDVHISARATSVWKLTIVSSTGLYNSGVLATFNNFKKVFCNFW